MKKLLVGMSLLILVGLFGCTNPRELKKDNDIQEEVNIGNDIGVDDAQLKEENMSVLVYFANDKLDPEVSCQKVFPVERQVSKTVQVAEAAINELLKGVSSEEKILGYTTLINDGVKLNHISIEGGVAKVDFDKKIEEAVGGSCRTGMIIRQITETLKQFDTVKEVVISVEGRIEDILQP